MSICGYWRRRKTETIMLSEVEINSLGLAKAKWIADRSQQKAAWELYVELVTRISVQPLGSSEGLAREALSSLHAIFAETRKILRSHGPRVAEPLQKEALSFGEISLAILNHALRPFLAKWHPELLAHEEKRTKGVSQRENELHWQHHDAFRKELEELRVRLSEYASLLAKAAGIKILHEK